ncbi:MAG: hypothetical protein U0990_12765 [Candidatus Nanopelagicales bacterium]|nr:hypothetical protein [Candidatus Nanopelagicales bacterium]
MRRLQWTGEDDIDRARYEDLKMQWECEDAEMASRDAALAAQVAALKHPLGFDPLYDIDGEHAPSMAIRGFAQEDAGD